MRTKLITLAALIATLLAVAGCGSTSHSHFTLPVQQPGSHIHRYGTSTIVAQIGDTLTAGIGTWTGDPTFTFQWQHCNSSASTCSNIAGATAQTYTVQSADATYYLRVAVTGTNTNGSLTGDSSLTAVVAATTSSSSSSSTTTSTTSSSSSSTTTSTTSSSGQTLNCFASPGACGYPDPAYNNVGVTNCSSLATQGFTPTSLPSSDYYYSGSGNGITITAANVTIANTNIGNWQFTVEANHTTFNNDCVAASGASGTQNIISVADGAGYTTVTNSTVIGQGCSITNAWDTLCTTTGAANQLVAGGDHAFYNNDLLIGGEENVGLGANSTLENSYVVANGYEAGGHGEDTCTCGGGEPYSFSNITITGNVLFNPFTQTADVFIAGAPTCTNTNIDIEDNLMAGGGWPLYECSGSSSYGSATMTFKNNNIARCEGTIHQDSGSGDSANDSYYCGSVDPDPSAYGSADGAGQDTHGYFPYGGGFAVDAYTSCGSGTTWSGNVWDDTGATVPCSGTP